MIFASGAIMRIKTPLKVCFRDTDVGTCRWIFRPFLYFRTWYIVLICLTVIFEALHISYWTCVNRLFAWGTRQVYMVSIDCLPSRALNFNPGFCWCSCCRVFGIMCIVIVLNSFLFLALYYLFWMTYDFQMPILFLFFNMLCTI